MDRTGILGLSLSSCLCCIFNSLVVLSGRRVLLVTRSGGIEIVSWKYPLKSWKRGGQVGREVTKVRVCSTQRVFPSSSLERGRSFFFYVAHSFRYRVVRFFVTVSHDCSASVENACVMRIWRYETFDRRRQNIFARIAVVNDPREFFPGDVIARRSVN